MELHIHYQGRNESPWMIEYLESKIGKLEKYLPSDSHIWIDLNNRNSYLSVKTTHHAYVFRGDGYDAFEAFTKSLENALRKLRLEHQKMIGKVHKKLFGLK